MQLDSFQTPVVMIVFNRPGTTRKVFDQLATVRPAKFLVVADGPRANKPGEEELCAQVREIVQAVNWPCELLTNFSDVNLGCQERVVSGLDWAFSLVEEAIVLEDDCLPDQSFFPFCEELLDKFRGDPRVSSISGTNLVGKHPDSDDSYFFTQLGGNWGWATWRSEWRLFDRHLTSWPDIKRAGSLSEVFEDRWAVDYWTRVFDETYAKVGPSAWDYQWLYSHLIHNSLTIMPQVNLVSNIGFGSGATHTSQLDPRLAIPARTMEFPLKHPKSMIPLRSMDRRIQGLFSVPLKQRVAGKVRGLAGKLTKPSR